MVTAGTTNLKYISLWDTVLYFIFDKHLTNESGRSSNIFQDIESALNLYSEKVLQELVNSPLSEKSRCCVPAYYTGGLTPPTLTLPPRGTNTHTITPTPMN